MRIKNQLETMLRYMNLRNIILPYPAFRETRYGSIIYRREMLYW